LDLPVISKSGPLALVKIENIVPDQPINLADDNSIQIFLFAFSWLHSTQDSRSIENLGLRSSSSETPRAPVIADATMEYLVD
jgi:hypothetical protein